MAEVALAAQSRPAKGSANTRRLRKEGRIPAVLYGHGTDPVSLSVDAKALRQALTTDSGMNALLSLEVDGKKQLAFTRDVQWHPVRRTVSHVDFLVVRKGESLTAEVPITLVGEAIVLGRTPKISAEDEAIIEGAPIAEDGESPVLESEEGSSEGEDEGEEAKSSDES